MKMPICRRARVDSFAIIIAMMAIFILAANAAMLWYSMKVEMRLAVKSDSETTLLWMGRSGVELARWVLAEEASLPRPCDALNQIWAGGQGGAGETNSPLSGINLDHYQVGDGWVSVKIIDEERFININSAGPQLLNNALTVMGVDAQDMAVVSDSIQDWVQPGNSPRLAGAKNDYYQSLDPPYYCKEAPMDDISELLLVKGVTKAIYDGGGGASGAAPKKFGFSPFETTSYPFGLKDIFTPYSDGKVNINTAGANVLQVLLDGDDASAEAIIKTRGGPGGDPGGEDATPYTSVGDLQRAGITSDVVGRIGQFCDVRSSTFEVDVTVHYLDFTRMYVAVLYRQLPNIPVVGFYWKQPEVATPAPSPEETK